MLPSLLLLPLIVCSAAAAADTPTNCSFTSLTNSLIFANRKNDAPCRIKDPLCQTHAYRQQERTTSKNCHLKFKLEQDSQANFCWLIPISSNTSSSSCSTLISSELGTRRRAFNVNIINANTQPKTVNYYCTITLFNAPSVTNCQPPLIRDHRGTPSNQLLTYNSYFSIDKRSGNLSVLRPLFYAQPNHSIINISPSPTHMATEIIGRETAGARLSVIITGSHSDTFTATFTNNQNILLLKSTYPYFTNCIHPSVHARLNKHTWTLHAPVNTSKLTACTIDPFCYNFTIKPPANINVHLKQSIVNRTEKRTIIAAFPYTRHERFVRLTDFKIYPQHKSLSLRANNGAIHILPNLTADNVPLNLSFSVFFLDTFVRRETKTINIVVLKNKLIGDTPPSNDDDDDEQNNLNISHSNEHEPINLSLLSTKQPFFIRDNFHFTLTRSSLTQWEVIGKIELISKSPVTYRMTQNMSICVDQESGYLYICNLSTLQHSFSFMVSVLERSVSVHVTLVDDADQSSNLCSTPIPKQHFFDIEVIEEEEHSSFPMHIVDLRSLFKHQCPPPASLITHSSRNIVSINATSLLLHSKLQPASELLVSLCSTICLYVRLFTRNAQFALPSCARKLTRIVSLAPINRSNQTVTNELVRLVDDEKDGSNRYHFSLKTTANHSFTVEPKTGTVLAAIQNKQRLPSSITLRVDVRRNQTPYMGQCIVQYNICRPRPLFSRLKYYVEKYSTASNPPIQSIRLPIISDCAEQDYLHYRYSIVNRKRSKVSINSKTGFISFTPENTDGSVHATVLVTVLVRKSSVHFVHSAQRKIRMRVTFDFIRERPSEVYRRFTQMDLPSDERPGRLLLRFAPTLLMSKAMFSLGGLNSSLFYIEPNKGDLYLTHFIKTTTSPSSFSVLIHDAISAQSEHIEVVVFVIERDQQRPSITHSHLKNVRVDGTSEIGSIVAELGPAFELVDSRPESGLAHFEVESGFLKTKKNVFNAAHHYELVIRRNDEKAENIRFLTMNVSISGVEVRPQLILPEQIVVSNDDLERGACVANVQIIGEVPHPPPFQSEQNLLRLESVSDETTNEQQTYRICLNPMLDDVPDEIWVESIGSQKILIKKTKSPHQPVYNIHLNLSDSNVFESLQNQSFQQSSSLSPSSLYTAIISSNLLDSPSRLGCLKVWDGTRDVLVYVETEGNWTNPSISEFLPRRNMEHKHVVQCRYIPEILPNTDVYLTLTNSSFKLRRVDFRDGLVIITPTGALFRLAANTSAFSFSYVAEALLNSPPITLHAQCSVICTNHSQTMLITLTSLRKDNAVARIHLEHSSETLRINEDCIVNVADSFTGYLFLNASLWNVLSRESHQCIGKVFEYGRFKRAIRIVVKVTTMDGYVHIPNIGFTSKFYTIVLHSNNQSVFDARQHLLVPEHIPFLFRLKNPSNDFEMDSRNGIVSSKNRTNRSSYLLEIEACSSNLKWLAYLRVFVDQQEPKRLKLRRSITLEYRRIREHNIFWVPLSLQSSTLSSSYTSFPCRIENGVDWLSSFVHDGAIAIKTRLLNGSSDQIKSHRFSVCDCGHSTCENVRINILFGEDREAPQFLDQHELSDRLWCEKKSNCYSTPAYDPDGGPVTYYVLESEHFTIERETGLFSQINSTMMDVEDVHVRAVDALNRSAISGPHRFVHNRKKWCSNFYLPSYNYTVYTRYPGVILRIPVLEIEDVSVGNDKGDGKWFKANIVNNSLLIKSKSIEQSVQLSGWYNFTLPIWKKHCGRQENRRLNINVFISETVSYSGHRKNRQAKKKSRWCSLPRGQVTCYSMRHQQACYLENSKLVSRVLIEAEHGSCCTQFTHYNQSIWIRDDLLPGSLYQVQIARNCCGQSPKTNLKINFERSSEQANRFFVVDMDRVILKRPLKYGRNVERYRLVLELVSQHVCDRMEFVVNVKRTNAQPPIINDHELRVSTNACFTNQSLLTLQPANINFFIRGSSSSNKFEFRANSLQCSQKTKLIAGMFNFSLYAFDGVYVSESSLLIHIDDSDDDDDEFTLCFNYTVKLYPETEEGFFVNLMDLVHPATNTTVFTLLNFEQWFHVDEFKRLSFAASPPNHSLIQLNISVNSQCTLRLEIELRDRLNLHAPQLVYFNELIEKQIVIRSEESIHLISPSITEWVQDLDISERNKLISFSFCYDEQQHLIIDALNGSIFWIRGDENSFHGLICLKLCNPDRKCSSYPNIALSLTAFRLIDMFERSVHIEISENVNVPTLMYTIPKNVSDRIRKHSFNLSTSSQLISVLDTGENFLLFLNQSPNYELWKDLSFELLVDSTAVSRFHVKVIDVNDHAPEFLKENFECDCTTPAKTQCKIEAIDKDASELNGRVSYESVQSSEHFHIDRETGVIECRSKHRSNHTIVTELTVNVSACDGALKCAFTMLNLKILKDRVFCSDRETVVVKLLPHPAHAICLLHEPQKNHLRIAAVNPSWMLEHVRLHESSIVIERWNCCIRYFDVFIRSSAAQETLVQFVVHSEAYISLIQFNQHITVFHSAISSRWIDVGYTTYLPPFLQCRLNHSQDIKHPDFAIDPSSGMIQYTATGTQSESPQRINVGLVVSVSSLDCSIPPLRSLVSVQIESNLRRILSPNRFPLTIVASDNNDLRRRCTLLGLVASAKKIKEPVFACETTNQSFSYGRTLGTTDTLHISQNTLPPFSFNCTDGFDGRRCLMLQVLNFSPLRDLKRRNQVSCNGITNVRIRSARDTFNCFSFNSSSPSLVSLNRFIQNMSTKFRIVFSLKTKSTHGTVLCMEQPSKLVLKVKWGILWLWASGQLTAFKKKQALDNVYISDGYWHDIVIDVQEGNGYVRVDQSFIYLFTWHTNVHQLSLGRCSSESVRMNRLIGCIANVSINSLTLHNTFQYALHCFKDRCDRCSLRPCLNGGKCLDGSPVHCSCPARFGGKYCEIDRAPCSSHPCPPTHLCLPQNSISASKHRCIRPTNQKIDSKTKTIEFSQRRQQQQQLMLTFIGGVILTALLFLLATLCMAVCTSPLVRLWLFPLPSLKKKRKQIYRLNDQNGELNKPLVNERTTD